MIVNGYETKDGILDLSDEPLSEIGNKAFISSKAVRTVILPASVRHIGDWAFARCSNLRSVKLCGPFMPGMFTLSTSRAGASNWFASAT